MDVILTSNVNVRQTPGTEFPPLAYYPAGKTITVLNQVTGQFIEGFGIWYQIDSAKYIWAGGTDTAQAANSLSINPNQWHLLQYNIPQLWQRYGCRGEGIKVGVIDTGIINNYTDYFSQGRVKTQSFSTSKTTDDIIGHGSHCAGIIGANGSKDNLYGVAPSCELYIGKIYDDDQTSQDSYFQNAVSAFSSGPDKVDIISLSQANPFDDSGVYSAAIKNAALNTNLIIVAAAGNSPGYAYDNLFFPAAIPPSVVVGAVDITYNTQNSTVAPDKVMLFAPGISIYSIGLTKFNPTETGTSAAAPFIVGILALGLQLLKKIPNSTVKITDLVPMLINTATQTNDPNQSGTSQIKIVNPTKFLNAISTNSKP